MAHLKNKQIMAAGSFKNSWINFNNQWLSKLTAKASDNFYYYISHLTIVAAKFMAVCPELILNWTNNQGNGS